MKEKNFLDSFSSYSSCILHLENARPVLLQLVCPVNKKLNRKWTLIVDGYLFVRLEPEEGISFHSLISYIQKENGYLKKEHVLELYKQATVSANKLFPKVKEEKLIERLGNMMEEIQRYIKCNRMQNVFSRIYPNTYSDLYKKPISVYVLESDKIVPLSMMLEHLERIEALGILRVVYPEAYLKSSNFKECIANSNRLYSVLELKDYIPTSKQIEELANAGLDEVILPVESHLMEREYRITGRNGKDIQSLIKLCIHHKIRVTAKTHITDMNKEYLDLVQYLHNLGVTSFTVSVEPGTEEAPLIIKRAFFYTNMNHLDLSLSTKGIIPDKQLKRMLLTPSFREEYKTMLYINSQCYAYWNMEATIPAGDLKFMSMENLYTAKGIRRIRKKGLPNEKKHEQS